MTFIHAQKDWIFVSDAHLTGRDSGEMETFLGFLDSEKERMTQLVIVGDLFEFLFGFKTSLSRQDPFPFIDYLPVLKKLQSLYHLGIGIKYFEGNHDFSLNSFFSEQFGTGVEVYPGAGEELLEGRKVFIAHGDLSNPKQRAYRLFRKILKNRWSYHLIQFAGPNIARGVARRLSDRSYQKYHGPLSSPSPAFKAFAHQKFLEGFEIVILGHSHFPEEAEEWIDAKRCLYFNVGDWRFHRSFLRFTPPDHFQLCRFGRVDF